MTNRMISLFSNNVEIAEDDILKLADFIYTHTNIKPMSKVIYLISRLLLLQENHNTVESALAEYNDVSKKLDIELHGADYSLSNILLSAKDDFSYIYSSICRIKKMTQGQDSLGIVFDTLLRGKYESGEGLGTFLTPEEVVSPGLDLCLFFLRKSNIVGNGGDLCGGTGRFIHELYKKSNVHGFNQFIIADQSAFSIELARINFLIESVSNVRFFFVADSITDENLKSFNGSFSLIATNPPFGAGKYLWTHRIKDTFNPNFLASVGFKNNVSRIDPSELFVYRNLLFLMEGGILGIVLPDGVAKSERLSNGLSFFEKTYQCSISKLAVISLPVATFSLGGTVAKTSFVILRKDNRKTGTNKTYIESVSHIGFLKKGNRRIIDPQGNDFLRIYQDIIEGKIKPKIKLPDLKSARNVGGTHNKRLSDLVTLRRDYSSNGTNADYHISILDVDETGYIEFRTVLSNAPTTKSMLCQPGDILVSCINPRIWRIAIIPDIPGSWSCSSEFAVLRPKQSAHDLALFFSLLSSNFSKRAIALARGTSSSRQRINKDALLTLEITENDIPKELASAILKRKSVYEARLAELRLFLGDSASLHNPSRKTSGA